MTEKTIDIDLQIESINSAISELKKHFGEYYELGALVHSIPLLEELKSLRKGRKEFPIATIKFNKEDMQKIVDEKVAQIKLDIQGIRAEAIDELKNKVCMHFADWQYSENDKCIKDIIESASESVDEIAEQMKAGGENEND